MIGKALLVGTAALVAGIGAAAAQPPALSHAGGYVHRFVSTTPKGSQTLYDQNSNDAGVAVISDYFDSGEFSSYDSLAADDFTVPAGARWSVTEIDVTGVYFSGTGPSDAQKVYFFKDKNGNPGKLIHEVDNLKGVDNNGSFVITLPGKGVKLKAGTYWVSVQAGMNFIGGAGEWGWEVNSVQHGNPAIWENPGNGFGVCPVWQPLSTCVGNGPDLMFALKGKSRSTAAD